MNGRVQLANLIPTTWSPLMYQELRSKVALLNLFSRDYEGAIKEQGDTVKISQILAPTGEVLTDDTATFNPEDLTVVSRSITANRRAVASVEITDLAKLQSIDFQMEVMASLVYSIQKQIETDIITNMLVPSAAAPDHQVAPAAASDLAVADVVGARTLLALQKVPFDGNMFLAADPSYISDLMLKQQVVGAEYGSINDLMAGEVKQLAGFKVFEHNGFAADTAVAFHTSAVQLVMQTGINVQVSNQHVNKKFSTLISADIVYGRLLADNKRMVKITG